MTGLGVHRVSGSLVLGFASLLFHVSVASGDAGDAGARGWDAYDDEIVPGRTYYWNDETGEITWTPPTRGLDNCLGYLRDHVGVPRDMGAAAARELRAELNWAIGVCAARKTV